MGWEHRGNNLYFYQKERLGNQVVSQYIGRGEIADLISLLAASEKEVRKAQTVKRQLEREIQEADLALDRQLDEIGDLVRGLLRVALMSNSFHTHKGEWRKRHD